jgi:hypothetical protein
MFCCLSALVSLQDKIREPHSTHFLSSFILKYLTQPMSVERFIPDRTPEEQELINKFIEKLLTVDERRTIASYISQTLDYNDLKFDSNEIAKVLGGTQNKQFLMGFNDKEDLLGLPVIQIYDFVNTIDRVLTLLRRLGTEISNIANGVTRSPEHLKKEIAHPFWIPWVSMDQLKTRMPDHEKIDAIKATYPGFVLGTQQQMWIVPINKADPAHVMAAREFSTLPPHVDQLSIYSNNRLQQMLVPKFNYDRACEEAYLLRFEFLKHLTALSQGLFRIQDTEAPKFANATAPQGTEFEDEEKIAKNAWINSFVESKAQSPAQPEYSLTVPIPPFETAAENTAEFALLRNWWRGNTIVDAASAGIADDAFAERWARFVLQPKDTNLAHYPRNLMGKTAQMISVSEADAQLEFQYPTTTEQLPMSIVSTVPETGGPIAQWFWTNAWFHGDFPDYHGLRHRVGADLSERICWPSSQMIKQNDDTLQNRLKYTGVDMQFFDLNVRADLRRVLILEDRYLHVKSVAPDFYFSLNTQAPRTAYHVSINRIHQVMKLFERTTHFHPIAACPRLGEAFRASRLESTLIMMYQDIQNRFKRALETDYVLRGSEDARTIPSISSQGSNVVPTDRCPPGMVPRYHNYDGAIIDPIDAVYEINGVEYLKSHVDPSKTDCVILAKAPMTEYSAKIAAAKIPNELTAVVAKLKETAAKEGLKLVKDEGTAAPETATTMHAHTVKQYRVKISPSGKVRSKSAPPPLSKRTDKRKYKCVVRITAAGHKQRYWVRK